MLIRNSKHELSKNNAQQTNHTADNHDDFGNDPALEFFRGDVPGFGDWFQFLSLFVGELLRRAAVVVEAPEEEPTHQHSDLRQDGHGFRLLSEKVFKNDFAAGWIVTDSPTQCVPLALPVRNSVQSALAKPVAHSFNTQPSKFSEECLTSGQGLIANFFVQRTNFLGSMLLPGIRGLELGDAAQDFFRN